jgi:hypothetical protein
MRALETEELPGPADYEALAPPPSVGTAWVRQVEGYQLWILYRQEEGPHVDAFGLAEREPERISED